MLIISAPRLLVDDRVTGPGAVVVDGDHVTEVLGEPPPPGADHLALTSGLLSPGLIDLQLNGAYGVDLVSASEAEWAAVANRLPETGVTAFQPTFITAPLDDLCAALPQAAAGRARVAAEPAAARVLGVHLEGPFLSRERAGVHDPDLMCAPTPERVEQVLAADRPDRVLRMVTLAPELPHGLDAVRRLVQADVRVSVGHSDATADVVRAAGDAGASMVTHLFNAQRGLGHREPGVAGQGLADPRFTLGLIADLRHVRAEVCLITMRAARGRVALVTDALAAAGMPAGRYQLGGTEVDLSDDDPLPRRRDGTIAGSALSLDLAVRNLAQLGVPLADVLVAATRVPADVLGERSLGRLAAGAHADLVWWDDDLCPRRVWIGGTETTGSGSVDVSVASAS